jgi:hypothetical protein
MDIELGLLTPHEYIYNIDLRALSNAGHRRIVIQVAPSDHTFFVNQGFAVIGTASMNGTINFVISRALTPAMVEEIKADGRTLSEVADWVQSTKDRMNRPKLNPCQLVPLPATDQNLGELLREYAAVLQEIADIVSTENGLRDAR